MAKKVSYYYDRIKVVGLQYRAQFHFADNGSGSLYMGSTVGLRYIRQTIAEESYGSRPTGYYEQAKKVVVPVGVRLDFRGGLDDAYGDVYLGANYALGGNRALSNAPFLIEESELSGLMFQIGCAFGLGN